MKKEEHKKEPKKEKQADSKKESPKAKKEKTSAASEKTEGKKVSAEKPDNYIPRLKTKFHKEIVPSLKKEFHFESPMRVPRLQKIAINQGVGDAALDRKIIESALNEITTITGQKPVATHAKKDISNFKIRKGMPIGVKVTLRGDMMYEFLDRFISTALPRIRDFRGISKRGFDGRGNYTLGILEQIIFPEINLDKVNKIRGMDITFVTTARNTPEAFALLKEFGIPFKKEDDEKTKQQKAAEFISTVAVKKEETKKQTTSTK